MAEGSVCQEKHQANALTLQYCSLEVRSEPISNVHSADEKGQAAGPSDNLDYWNVL